MATRTSRLHLGPSQTLSTRSEAELTAALQTLKRPVADVSFTSRKDQACLVSGIDLGTLVLNETVAAPIAVQTLVDPHLSFVLPFAGGGRVVDRRQSIRLPASAHVIRFSFAQPMLLQKEAMQIVTLRPSLEELRRAVGCVSPEQAGLVDRLMASQLSIHSGRVDQIDYHDQLLSLFTVVRDARGDDAFLRRIGIADIVVRILAEFLVAQNGAEPDGQRSVLPRSDAAVDVICDHIRASIGNPLTIPAMERLTGMTGRSLNNAFHRRFGCSPQQWQRNLLLDEARRRLLTEELAPPVKAIAYGLGFASSSSFSAHYQRRFGEKPSQTLTARRGPGTEP